MEYSKPKRKRKSYGDGSIRPLTDRNGKIVPNAYFVQVSGKDKDGNRIRPSRSVYGTKAEARRVRDELKDMVAPDPEKETAIDALTAQIAELNAKLEEERRHGLDDDFETLTVGSWCSSWIDKREASGQLSKSTVSNYRNYIDKWIIPLIGSTVMCDLTPEAVEDWHVYMRDGDASPRTAQAAHKVLKQALKKAVRDRKMASNPCDVVDTPKAETGKRGYLEPNELERMLDVLDGMDETPFTMAVRIAVATGCRRGEILALQWRNVDFDKCTIGIVESLDQIDRAGKLNEKAKETKAPKTESGVRSISIDKATMRRMKAWKASQRLSLTSMGLKQRPSTPVCASLYKARVDGARKFASGYLDPSDFSKRFASFCKENGFNSSTGKRLCFHELRHTQATLLISSGEDIVNVAGRLGHHKPSITTDMYADAMPQKDRECADVMENFIDPARRSKKSSIKRVS